ncbi:MAG: Xaa-Pro peptidase family protein [Azospirillaceae bacterium]
MRPAPAPGERPPGERVFSGTEFARRLAAVRRAMAAEDLDGLLVAKPENIYYLTGLDHWGFFAPHVLLVPADGEMVLVARAMEAITMVRLLVNTRFSGHADHEDPAGHVVQAMAELGLAGGRLGIEKNSLFLTPRLADAIQFGEPGADWRDASRLVDDIRLVQSAEEIAYTRRAALAADAGMMAAIEAIHDGASDYEVAAECHRAMILAGSEYPGFGPFIRPAARIGEEHTTWRGDRFHSGEPVFLELAAACRKYQAPMGRLVYIGSAPGGIEAAVEMAIAGMAAIRQALRPGALAGDVYDAWHAVAAAYGLPDYHRHHCGYLVGIGFPPSWTGGSMVTGLAPHSTRVLEPGMVFHAHSWFTNTDAADYFISNTVLLTEQGAEVLTDATPETLILR